MELVFPDIADFDLAVDDHASPSAPYTLIIRLVLLDEAVGAGSTRVVAGLARLPDTTTVGLALSARLAKGVGGEHTKVGWRWGLRDDGAAVGGVGVEGDRSRRGCG
jgi:hypothetical protein